MRKHKEQPAVGPAAARVGQFKRCLPGALKPTGTMLYVGGRPGHLQIMDLFVAAGWKVDILEAWQTNVEALLVWNDEAQQVRRVMLGDIRAFVPETRYDAVVWWHGPEHVAPDEVAPTIERLGGMACRLVILAAPLGEYPQGTVYGNPFEEHLSTACRDTFKVLGYETNVVGSQEKQTSNLLAWKWLKEERS